MISRRHATSGAARRIGATLSVLAFALGASGCGSDQPAAVDTQIADYPLSYLTTHESMPSTHEITYDQRGGKTLWVTGMMHDSLVEIGLDGTASNFFAMPDGSTPHGVEFDADSNLYVGLQYADGPDDRGQIARVDPQTGAVLETHAVGADPHGMSIDPDGSTVWFTGKLSNVIGRVTAEGEVRTWPLPTPDAMPIYITPGPDGDEHMWFTELTGNKIGRIAPDGSISEFPIPTPDSRPIAIVVDPRGDALWFSQEAGNNVARIDLDGTITEYPVPESQSNVILGALTFDSDGDLWIQQYVNQDQTIGPQGPGGDDHLVRLAADALTRDPDQLRDSDFTFHAVPTQQSVLHRIIEGPDGGIWFTELKADKIGRLQPD